MRRAAAVAPSGWRLGGEGRLSLDVPRVMGVVNLTPDSFSDGGELADLDAALDRARALVAEGAAVIDVGGESTRPGATPVPADEELRRVLPFVREAAGELGVPISIDTRRARVAGAALAAGATIVNDVSGLAFDADMAPVVAAHGAGLVLMHMRGTPAGMQRLAHYTDVVAEVRDELGRALDAALAAGVAAERIVLDPGIGFAKDAAHSLELLGRLDELVRLPRPLLVGPSRKSFLGHVVDVPPRERVAATVAACVLAWERGARVFRVHDVAPVAQALAVAQAVAAAVAAAGAAGRGAAASEAP
jgi:dihydropteroate synthase